MKSIWVGQGIVATPLKLGSNYLLLVPYGSSTQVVTIEYKIHKPYASRAAGSIGFMDFNFAEVLKAAIATPKNFTLGLR